MTGRRDLLLALGTVVLSPRAGFAQSRPPLVGYVTSQVPDLFFDAFQRRLADMGYVEGRNIAIDRLDMAGRLDQAQRLVLELAAKKPNVIVLPNVALMNAAKKSGLSIPFVVVSSVDPVENRFAASLSRPGGNFTGIASLTRDLSAKRIEVLRDLLPAMSRLAVLWDANGPGPKVGAAAYEAAAQRLKLHVQSLPIRDAKTDFEAAFQAAASGKAQALVLVSNPLVFSHRESISALAARYRIPMLGEHELWAESALFIYSASFPDIGQRLAGFVHRILQGAKPGDLPFEQPTKFDFVLNLKIAKALGITIPQSILVRADRVIE